MSNLRGIRYHSDSTIKDCEFRQLADFGGSRNWELHFSGVACLAGITFEGASGRVSFDRFKEIRTLIDLSGMRVFFRPLLLRGFAGTFRCKDADFEQFVDLSRAQLTASDFSRAGFRSDLVLAGASFGEGVSFEHATFDGALTLTDIDVGGTGILDLANVSLSAPEKAAGRPRE